MVVAVAVASHASIAGFCVYAFCALQGTSIDLAHFLLGASE